MSRRATDSIVAELPRRHIALQIGCRWSAGHRISRDEVTGAYEERNPPLTREAEQIQAALVGHGIAIEAERPKGNHWVWWAASMLLLPAVYIFCRVVWP